MAVKHTVLLQKSFSKLPYSSFETLAKAEKSHAGKFQKTLDVL